MNCLRQLEPGRRIWAVYEPLTYHRTAAMLDEFADVLATQLQQVLIRPTQHRPNVIAPPRSINMSGSSPRKAAPVPLPIQDTLHGAPADLRAVPLQRRPRLPQESLIAARPVAAGIEKSS